jgi:hypothetical protein
MNDNNAIGGSILRECTPGQLWVFDRGCTDRGLFLNIHNKGAYFLTRHHRQTLKVVRTVFVDETCAPTQAPEPGERDFVVDRVQECLFAGYRPAKGEQYTSLGLVVVHGYRYDRRNGTGWSEMSLMTNLPLSADGAKIGPYTYDELAQTYRDRWEIETFFKKIKGHLSFDHLLNSIKITIYMTLIAAMMMIWAKEILGGKHGWNIVKFWLEVNCREWIELTIRHHRPYQLLRDRGG